MNVAPHLSELYARTSRRYKKLISKLRRDAVSAYQRKISLHELKKLVKILRGLQSQPKIAAATGTLYSLTSTAILNSTLWSETRTMGDIMTRPGYGCTRTALLNTTRTRKKGYTIDAPGKKRVTGYLTLKQ